MKALNHRDFRWRSVVVNPTLKLQLSEANTVDLSYEYLDHERFIDRVSQQAQMVAP